ncbi:MAG: motility protein A [Eubacteriales bacterium]
MDIATLVAFILCIGFVIFAIVLEGFSALFNFLDAVSVLVTIGGAFSAVLIAHPLKQYLAGLKAFGLIMKASVSSAPTIIQKIIDLSNLARKEGLLALEEAASESGDPFIKKGILLIVDGTDPELIRGIMETEMINIEVRHKKLSGFWQDVASMGPAWGMIGTLVGLVNMLQNMDDPSSIGPAMAVALLTTLYGSLIANWVAIPTSKKLMFKNSDEMMEKEIMIEGLLSIQAGENPRVIEEKLKSFLSPTERTQVGESGGEGGE